MCAAGTSSYRLTIISSGTMFSWQHNKSPARLRQVIAAKVKLTDMNAAIAQWMEKTGDGALGRLGDVDRDASGRLLLLLGKSVGEVVDEDVVGLCVVVFVVVVGSIVEDETVGAVIVVIIVEGVNVGSALASHANEKGTRHCKTSIVSVFTTCLSRSIRTALDCVRESW